MEINAQNSDYYDFADTDNKFENLPKSEQDYFKELFAKADALAEKEEAEEPPKTE
jgi:hypothetical protein